MTRLPDHPESVESERLDPRLEHELAEALRSAWLPAELDPRKNELLIELALEDPLAPPSPDELVESERLRRALDGEFEHPDGRLAAALRAAGAPAPLAAEAMDRLAERALAPRRSGNVIFVAFGALATAAVAAAAAAMLFISPAKDARVAAAPAASAAPQPELVPSRSTSAHFSEKFETADTSERVDRIALARARDLRNNRYTAWGVR